MLYFKLWFHCVHLPEKEQKFVTKCLCYEIFIMCTSTREPCAARYLSLYAAESYVGDVTTG